MTTGRINQVDIFQQKVLEIEPTISNCSTTATPAGHEELAASRHSSRTLAIIRRNKFVLSRKERQPTRSKAISSRRHSLHPPSDQPSFHSNSSLSKPQPIDTRQSRDPKTLVSISESTASKQPQLTMNCSNAEATRDTQHHSHTAISHHAQRYQAIQFSILPN
jgi:hypothetical protein